MAKQCCCNWGAAVSGEYPEFGCAKCPVHKATFGETELCRRHKRAEAGDQIDTARRPRQPYVCMIPNCGCDGTWHA